MLGLEGARVCPRAGGLCSYTAVFLLCAWRRRVPNAGALRSSLALWLRGLKVQIEVDSMAYSSHTRSLQSLRSISTTRHAEYAMPSTSVCTFKPSARPVPILSTSGWHWTAPHTQQDHRSSCQGHLPEGRPLLHPLAPWGHVLMS